MSSLRFVLAIAAFVVAVVLLGFGFAQRTVFLPSDVQVAALRVSGNAPYTVIPGSVLNSHGGQQTLQVHGASDEFVAYGRTDDVMAWIGTERYAQVRYDTATGDLTSRVRTGRDRQPAPSTPTPTPTPGAAAATPAPVTTPTPTPTPTAGARSGTSAVSSDPRGSDLWLEQFTGPEAPTTRLAVPDSVSVIVATNGSKPAPNRISISWPLNVATPLAGPLLLGGLLFAVIGVICYLWALRGWRRARGPRRSGPPGPPLPPSGRHGSPRALPEGGRRRAIRRAVAVVPVALVATVALAGCSAEYWPAPQSSAPTKTPTPIASDLPGQGTKVQPPAVTPNQLQDIVDRIAAVASKADQSLSADVAATRFAGPVLAERTAAYLLRSKKVKDAGNILPITDARLTIGLPQATSSWPRTILAVQKPATTDQKQPPVAMVLRQASPRSNYQVVYAVGLQGDAVVPGLAPANVGTAVVPPDSKLLEVAPGRVSRQWADLLDKGESSKFARRFGTTSTSVVAEDQKYRKDITDKFAADGGTVTAAFSVAPGDGPTVALATNNSGALVATDVTETMTVTPKPNPLGPVVVTPGPSTAALAGITTTTKGVTSTTGYQLLFYVPPAGSSKKIQLLGYTTGPLTASELP